MKRLLPLMFLLAVAALSACSTETVILRPLPPVIDPDKSAEVTVIRPRSIIAEEWPFYVLVAEQPVFDLRNGENTRFRIPAGRQSFAIRCSSGLESKPPETRLEHDFRARSSVFFVVSPKDSCVSIDEVDAAAAAGLVSRTRFRAVGTVNVLAQATSEAPAVLSATPAPPAAPGAPPASASAAKDQVAAATVAWAEAYNSRDPARILSSYDPDALLWETSAQRLASGAAAIGEYFKSAPQRPGERVTLGEQHVRVYGDTAVDSGTYTFWLTRDGKIEAVPARYSLVYRNRGGKWLIVDHHSSRVPFP